MSESECTGGSQGRVVILGDNNVVGDGNTVVWHGKGQNLTEEQAFILAALPEMPEPAVQQIYKLVSGWAGSREG